MTKRASRTYKLRLSPAGMDMLIEAHCRVIKATRQLIPWGTTLFVALIHLDSMASANIVTKLDDLSGADLIGPEVRFLGAPSTLIDLANAIVEKVALLRPGQPRSTIASVYMLALHVLLVADAPNIRRAYREISS